MIRRPQCDHCGCMFTAELQSSTCPHEFDRGSEMAATAFEQVLATCPCGCQLGLPDDARTPTPQLYCVKCPSCERKVIAQFWRMQE